MRKKLKLLILAGIVALAISAPMQAAEKNHMTAQYYDIDGDIYYDSESIGQAVVDYACQFVGNPYCWGGTSLTNGADCSGFTQSVFANFGIEIPRVAADQGREGTSIDLDDIQIGDLLFYGGNYISHVSIYIGDDQVVHASNSRDGIIISSMEYYKPSSARRYW